MPLRVETTPATAKAIERAVIARLMVEARKKGISDPIVRDLIPSIDLCGPGVALSGPIWAQSHLSGISGLTYANVYSGTNDDDRAFAIFKVANAREEPLTIGIKFYDGVGRTAIKDLWQVEHAWLNEDCEAYCDPESVIYYGWSKGYNIDIAPRPVGLLSGLTFDRLIFGGKVVEPRGKTITPAVGEW